MAAAQQHRFDFGRMTMAEVIAAAQQHQFDDLTWTAAEVEEMEVIWQHRGALVSEAEEFLRRKKSWWNLMTRLIVMFLGVAVIIFGATTSGLTRADWIAIGVVSCMLFVEAIGLLCWDAYARKQMEHFLAFMHSVSDALDMESAGQLAAPIDHQLDP